MARGGGGMEGAESWVAAYNSNSNQDIQRKFGTVKNNLQGRSQTQNLGGAFFFFFFFGKTKLQKFIFFNFMETDRLFPRSS